MITPEEIRDEARQRYPSAKDNLTESASFDGFIAGAHWMNDVLTSELKQLFIEKAYDWLKDNIYNRVYECGDKLGFPTTEFLNQFKKYMEE